MEEAILNSLLRYSKQVTPTRDTYPVPSGAWSGNLRKSNPPINLSTYYLLDQPGLSSSPTRNKARQTTCISTTAASPPKRAPVHSLKKPSVIGSTEPSRRITDPDTEIKAAVAKEKQTRALLINENSSFDSSPDFDEYKKSQESIISDLHSEIAQLKEELLQSSEKINSLQSLNPSLT